ncbi:MAG TPA: hypothetical protein PKM78_07410 [Anaerolineae bacterium]|nr:hypothetical protein [Anaerolineae bacterium]HNU05130.1 hypothetical protein [Anaerolineae bacterium]
MIEDLIAFVAEAALSMNLIPVELVGSVALGTLGLKLYSAVKEPTDSWGEILKYGSIALMVAAAIGLVTIAGQLI